MALMPLLTRPTLDRTLAMAEELRRRAEAAGAPPAVGALPPRARTAYDRLIDALNRLPRPVTVIGTLALLGAAAVAPDWFAARMEALARMPEGLWWLVGAVLSLHFGARFQAHAQEHERSLLATVAPPAVEPPAEPATPGAASPGPDADLALATLAPGPSAALDDWLAAAPRTAA